MDLDGPIKKGYLLFPPHGVLSHIKKSWQKKYCELFRASKYGIERLEVFDSEEDASSNLSTKIITLENCVKIIPEPQKLEANVFVVVTKSVTHYFASVEEQEKFEWLSAFQLVAFKESAGGPVIEEDNELYCSSGEGTFLVKLVQSEASARCGLETGPYTLLLTSSAIQLKDIAAHTVRATWPYCFIRRYGYCDGRFTFEAGRMCDTGEGKFLVEHPNQQQIYRCLALKMRSMRKFLGSDVSATSQLSVALGMEARSRSPIPPSTLSDHPVLRLRAASQGNLLEPHKPLVSPTVETNPLVVINAPVHLKPRGLSASHGALDVLSRKSPTLFHAKVVDIDLQSDSAPPLQPKPLKPPRRPFMPEKRLFLPRSNRTAMKSTDDYDDVEVREDAWRTLGLDEPAHTEDYEPVESVETTRRENVSIPAPTSISRPKFLPIKPASDVDNYNTLQYFGSGKNTSKAAYKQIVLSPTSPESPASINSSPLTFHDYDEVAEPNGNMKPPEESSSSFNTSAQRVPDDSHVGYGTIRRLQEHKLYNSFEYAVVTKPRQV